MFQSPNVSDVTSGIVAQISRTYRNQPMRALWHALYLYPGTASDPSVPLAMIRSLSGGLEHRSTIDEESFSIKSGWEAHPGSTPLILAAHANRTDVAKALLQAGADPTAKDAVKSTAIHSASIHDNADLVGALAEAGADINTVDENALTPLHIAATFNACASIHVLVARGADVRVEDHDGSTPLHRAAWRCNLEAMMLLIAYGADVNARNANSQTPLLQAARALQTGDRLLETLTALVDKGADVRALDCHSWSALHWACSKKNTGAAVAYLTSLGCDVDAVGSDGAMPLRIATVNRKVQAAEQLLRQGASVNTTSQTGEPLLHGSINEQLLIELLLDNGADLEQVDREGATVLHHAARHGSATIIALMAEGAKVTAIDRKGKTPKDYYFSSGEATCPPRVKDSVRRLLRIDNNVK